MFKCQTKIDSVCTIWLTASLREAFKPTPFFKLQDELSAHNNLLKHIKLFKFLFIPLAIFLINISNSYLPQHFRYRTKKISIFLREMALAEELLWGRKIKKENLRGCRHNTSVFSKADDPKISSWQDYHSDGYYSNDLAGSELSFYIIKSVGMLKHNTLTLNFYWAMKNVQNKDIHRTEKKSEKIWFCLSLFLF